MAASWLARLAAFMSSVNRFLQHNVILQEIHEAPLYSLPRNADLCSRSLESTGIKGD